MDKSANEKQIDQYSYELGVVGGFSELVNAGVKQLALSAPMTPEVMDDFVIDAEKVAAKHGVSVFREPDLIVTDLFPSDVASGMDVLILYQGTALDAYNALKSDKLKLVEQNLYDGKNKETIARRFGRLLSYTPAKINSLLAENTSFRTMADFGIRASNLFLYYNDLKKATDFYTEVLGMELLADYEMATVLRMAKDAYLILVDVSKGMHTADEPKTVALALLTDQLAAWYDYLVDQGVKIKYPYKPKTGNAHDGFVAIDPEGYLLEFETFKQHPENERFIPILDQNETIFSKSGNGNQTPNGLGIKSTITWLYYKDILSMQTFYEEVLGLELVADQGWAKIYRVSKTGFIGLVDEKRGMHQFTENKAVNVSFILDDLQSWFDYVQSKELFELRSEEVSTGPETRYKAFVGYDPEGYFMEFDRFFPHDDHSKLLEYLYSE